MTTPRVARALSRSHRSSGPREVSIRPADIGLVLAANGVIVVGMWMRHGGIDQLATGAGLATGLGQVTALLGTTLALAGILLMARVPWIDHIVGGDRLAAWHRWLGFGTLWLLLGHFAFTTLGWAMASGRAVIDELLDMLSSWDLLIATVGLALLVLVAVTSIRAARRRLAYETWYGLHLYSYLGIA